MFPLPIAVEDHWLDDVLAAVAGLAPAGSFFSYPYILRALLALILVSISCGAVGSLVVGRRMAFFSDALAHTAFAGVSIGFVFFSAFLATIRPAEEFWDWVLPVMLVFGVLVGFGIAAVSEKTGLSSDTVIGVFFAAGIGLTAMLRKIMQNRRLFTLEDFLFGDPLLVPTKDLVYLAILAVVVLGTLALISNHLLLSGFSSSLARSRQVPQQFAKYLFVMLLALVVNLCVRTVGVLLINALLVVPAATAANLARNLRQVFWLTAGLTLFASVVGYGISWEVEQSTGTRLGIPGAIILVCVVLFVLSTVVGPLWRDRKRASQAG